MSRTNMTGELNSRKPLPNIQYSSIAVQAGDDAEELNGNYDPETKDFSALVDIESPASEHFQPAFHSSAASRENEAQDGFHSRQTNATNNNAIRDTSTQFPETKQRPTELRLPLSTTPTESPDAAQLRNHSQRVSAGAHRRERRRHDDSDDSSDSELRRREQARLDELRRFYILPYSTRSRKRHL